MSKTIKSLICPQCNASDADKLPDGTYKCRFCGTIFMIDDDTQNIIINNINNINYNITQENTVHYYNNSSQTQYVGNNRYSWMDKKTRLFIVLMIGFLFTVTFICSQLSSSSPQKVDSKQKNTLSENLYDKEEVFYSCPFVYHDSAAFFTLTKRYSDSKVGHLRIIMADDLSVKNINTPSTVDLSGKQLDFNFIRYHLILGKDKKIYKLNLETLDFYNFTDSILALNKDLKSSIILNISNGSYGSGFVFVTTNGREYSYNPILHEITDNQTTKKEKDNPANNTKATQSTIFVLCGYDKYVDQDLYKIIINDKGGDTQRKWKEKIVFYKSSKLKPKQINSDIISMSCVKQLGLNKAKIIHTTDQYLYMVYEVQGINFMRKTDLMGEEIWTKKIPYEYKTEDDVYSGITWQHGEQYGSSLIFYNKDHFRSEPLFKYMIIDKNDNIKFVKERWNRF